MIEIKDIPIVLEKIREVQSVYGNVPCGNDKFDITKTKFLCLDESNILTTVQDTAHSLILSQAPLRISYNDFTECVEIRDYRSTKLIFRTHGTEVDDDIIFQYSTEYENLKELIDVAFAVKDYKQFVSVTALTNLDLNEVLNFLKEAYATLTQSSALV